MLLICTKTCGTCRKAVALLNERGVNFEYREYRETPLSRDEIVDVLAKLDMGPRELLRVKDAVKLEIDHATLDDDALIDAMAEHPGLIQRPIGIVGDKAVLGRPHEALLELV